MGNSPVLVTRPGGASRARPPARGATATQTPPPPAPAAHPGRTPSSGPGRRCGGRARTTHRRDDLWMVRRTDPPAQPRRDPEVVLGHLPASSLGTAPRGDLRPDGGAGGRAAGRDP